MRSVFYYRLIFMVAACMLHACMPNQYSTKPKPITISSSKLKQIQRLHKTKNREAIRVYDSRIVRWDIINRNKVRGRRPMERKNYINASMKNRKAQYRAYVKKKKSNKNYEFYRESIKQNELAEKTSFSIYDK
ncbi:MAG: hypothetical protein SFY32_03205 [Bacteroidota bacterium]|nr:hypothetical protein [Bacteroidota bacterium]